VRAVATPDGLLTIDADGTVRRPGQAKPEGGAGAFPMGFRETGVTWDPSRDALLAFGDGDNKVNTTWEFKAGAWKPVKATRKPKARQGPELLHVPGVGVVMVSGWNKKCLDERCVFDGKTWSVGEPLGGVAADRVLFLAHDGPTQALLLGEASEPDHGRKVPSEVVVRRYDGPGQWAPVARLAFQGTGFDLTLLQSGWAFDPATREVVGAGRIQGTGSRGFISAPLGAALDALPRSAAAAVAPAAAPAAAPRAKRSAWYLVQRDEPPGKFWFAERQGSGWTASWGRRGAKPQSKTYTFQSPARATTDLEKTVAGKLAEGYAEAPEGAAVAALASRTAWPMKVSNRAGRPGQDCVHGARGVSVPRCKGCKQDMEVLGLFHAHPERLPLKKAAALALFMCRGACETWRPASGANAVLFVPAKVLKDEQPAIASLGVTYPKAVLEVDREREGLPAVSPGGCKLGGYPTWVQESEPQTCATCQKPMVLAVQLDAGDTGMNFGDVGVGYAFICPDEHEGRFLWQCA
jgi:predicted DNA-binding WGR domain protein